MQNKVLSERRKLLFKPFKDRENLLHQVLESISYKALRDLYAGVSRDKLGCKFHLIKEAALEALPLSITIHKPVKKKEE